MRRTARFVVLSLFAACCIAGLSRAQSVQGEPDRGELLLYLQNSASNPEDYVVSKFEDHDVVFLGEWHRIRHDVQLVQRLIPRLYAAGIRHLGIEFGNAEDQQLADQLVTSPRYDEALARELTFRYFPSWGYREYIDLYRYAWTLNQSLPEGAEPFRIVHLSYRIRWDLQKPQMTAEDRRLVFHKGSTDDHMAEVILREFIDQERKALVYCGLNHAFTRYRQPNYDFERGEVRTLVNNRAGNIVYREAPGRVFLISLHAPWPTKESFNEHALPMGGVIDEVLAKYGRPAGFDVRGTPFGRLRDGKTYYSAGYEDFSLEDMVDGYIFQKPIGDYEGVTVDPQFVTDENFSEAVLFSPNLAGRDRLTAPGDFIDGMRSDADLRKRFERLR